MKLHTVAQHQSHGAKRRWIYTSVLPLSFLACTPAAPTSPAATHAASTVPSATNQSSDEHLWVIDVFLSDVELQSLRNSTAAHRPEVHGRFRFHNVTKRVECRGDLPSTDGPESAGTMRIRGKTSSAVQWPEFSWHVELQEGQPSAEFLGSRKLYLNKHPHDPTRIRNHLAYALVGEHNRLLASRTALAQICMHVEAQGSPLQHVDLGLFTFVEPPSKRFLKRNNKATDRACLVQAKDLHTGVLEKVQALDTGQNDAIDVEVGDKDQAGRGLARAFTAAFNYDPRTWTEYFDRNNALDFLAQMIVLRNIDSTTQNFLLYSDDCATNWSIHPWDLDGSFDLYSFRKQSHWDNGAPRWTEGFHAWSEVPLWRFLLSQPDADAQLTERICALTGWPDTELCSDKNRLQEGLSGAAPFTQQSIRRRVSAIAEVVNDFVSSTPDSALIAPDLSDYGATTWNEAVARFDSVPTQQLDFYARARHRPLPFFHSLNCDGTLTVQPTFHIAHHSAALLSKALEVCVEYVADRYDPVPKVAPQQNCRPVSFHTPLSQAWAGVQTTPPAKDGFYRVFVTSTDRSAYQTNFFPGDGYWPRVPDCPSASAK